MPTLTLVFALALGQPLIAAGSGADAVATASPSDDELRDLRRLIAATEPSDPDYPEMLLRLAGRLVDDSEHKEEVAAGLAGAGGAAQVEQLEAAATALRAEAATLYAQLVDEPRYAGFRSIDVALYELAALRSAAGDHVGMREPLFRLIREFPLSPRVPGAYLLFADDYFNAGEMAHAERLYEKVADFAQARERPYALYKLAWVRLDGSAERPRDPAQALEYLVRVLRDTATDADLRRAARRDVIPVYVEIGRSTKAAAFFRRIAEDPTTKRVEDVEMLRGLRQAYLDAGRDADAAVISRALAEAERRAGASG
jgi:tetratricopeptide (TPR) repeat protein